MELPDCERAAMRYKAVDCFRQRFEVCQASESLLAVLATLIPA
jgi:hypothetical protein